MKKEEQQPLRNRADRQRESHDKQASVTANSANRPEYIAYPKAMKLLAERLDATPEEMAAWLFSGPEFGGLVAYRHVNRFADPPMFSYVSYAGNGNADYLSPLMDCWFIAEEIANFQPIERYITGKALIDRWSQQPGIQPEAYVQAKIRESRLGDYHPIYGGTEATFPKFGSYPPLETGLFARSQIEEIEASDFGNDEVEKHTTTTSKPSVSASEIRRKFAIIKSEDANDIWWKKMMRNASDNGLSECRVGRGRKGPVGSLWRPDLIAGWLVDRHEKKLDGMNKNATRAALRKCKGFEETAEDWFPSDE